MQFFRYFQTTPYTVADSNGPMFHVMTNITQHARIVERLAQYQSSFYDYVIRDGERPDMVAQSLYGSTDYTWVILLVNNIFSLYDWPLTTEEMNSYIESKYGSIDAAQRQIVEYYDVNNARITQTMYNDLPTGFGFALSAYDVELRENEAKRTIRVVRSAFIGPLTQSLRTVFA